MIMATHKNTHIELTGLSQAVLKKGVFSAVLHVLQCLNQICLNYFEEKINYHLWFTIYHLWSIYDSMILMKSRMSNTSPVGDTEPLISCFRSCRQF